MREQDRAFEKWIVRENLSGYDIEARMLKSWQAATAEANKRIEALESEVAELKERIETHIAINKSLLMQRDKLQSHINDLR